MASRSFHQLKHAQQGLVKIEGSFAPNGSSALVTASTKGKGFTVVRTSAGLYTITLADRYADLISASHSKQVVTADDTFLQFGTIVTGSAAANTVQIRNWDVSGAAATDIAADANNRIHFSLTLRNTAVS
jgi:hypothetical protein